MHATQGKESIVNIRLIRLIAPALLVGALTSRAHLCNDVFAQARDNLAVKVDIRDGQLRINQEASFRVHLLNTMDRDIVDIRLEIISPEFDGVVTPSPDWKGFPHLKTSLRGGRKEFYDVTLKRKSGTVDGKYTIGLRLFNGQNRAMEFKTVAIADAMAVVHVPRAPKDLRVDGKPGRAEWVSAALLCDFSKQVKARYLENAKSECETRVRLSADNRNLYALVTTPALGTEDTLHLFLAADTEAAVRKIALDLKTGALTGAPEGSTALPSPEGMEVSIPLAGLDLPRAFLVNLARTRDGARSFWRGADASVDQPVVFARMVLAD